MVQSTWEEVRPAPKEITSPNRFWDLLKSNIENIFIWGELEEGTAVKRLLEVISSQPFKPKNLLRPGLAIIRDLLPTNVQLSFRERGSEKFPLEIPELSGFRVLPHLGEGFVNIVYLIHPDTGNMYTAGLNKKSFPNRHRALQEAKSQQQNFEQVSRIFANSNLVIPREQSLIFQDYNSRHRVMFIREFIPGPLQDIFELSPEQLREVISRNPHFANQLQEFVHISNKNLDFVLNRQLDILGKNNLCIAGIKGQEQVVLLDPHTRTLGNPNDEHKMKIIAKRLEYLGSMINQNSYSAVPLSVASTSSSSSKGTPSTTLAVASESSR